MKRAAFLLEKALTISVHAHSGQTDRYGKPYILHPLRVMSRVESEAEKIVAILHDVIEDTDWTLQKLAREGFSKHILAALDCLTKKEGEQYDALIKRAAANALARRVKLADLQDNMDLRRLDQLRERDVERFNKYIKAFHFLSSLEDSGSARSERAAIGSNGARSVARSKTRTK